MLWAWPSSLRDGSPGVLVLEQLQTVLAVSMPRRMVLPEQPGGQSDHRRKIDNIEYGMGARGHGEELTRALGLVEEEVEERDDVPAHVQRCRCSTSCGSARSIRTSRSTSCGACCCAPPSAPSGTRRTRARCASRRFLLAPQQKCVELLAAAATRDAATRQRREGPPAQRAVDGAVDHTPRPDHPPHRDDAEGARRPALVRYVPRLPRSAASGAQLNIGFEFSPTRPRTSRLPPRTGWSSTSPTITMLRTASSTDVGAARRRVAVPPHRSSRGRTAMRRMSAC